MGKPLKKTDVLTSVTSPYEETLGNYDTLMPHHIDSVSMIVPTVCISSGTHMLHGRTLIFTNNPSLLQIVES